MLKHIHYRPQPGHPIDKRVEVYRAPCTTCGKRDPDHFEGCSVIECPKRRLITAQLKDVANDPLY